MTRDPARAASLFGASATGLECVSADTRNPATLPSVLDGVTAIACCTGTTAFPSRRWKGGNGPKETDEVGVKNLIAAAVATTTLARFILVSSAGVRRADRIPYSILNAFGVLTAKAAGEAALAQSGLPWTVLRPGRLTDGPYTSYDLNTLLRATANDARAVVAASDDVLDGQTSRIAVAEAVVQSLTLACTQGAALSLESAGAKGPGTDAGAWEALLCGAVSTGRAQAL